MDIVLMELNNLQFRLYSMNAGMAVRPLQDIVDGYMQELIDIDEFDSVKDFVSDKFGDINGEKWLDYPDLHKEVYLLVEDCKIEFCALKNEKQYFGKGWKIVNQNNSI